MSDKRQNLLIVLGLLVLVGMIGGLTFAFYNYSRTGTSNNVTTGDVSFSSDQDGIVTLSDLFPIQATGTITAQTPGVGSLAIHVTGSTNYSTGIEYLVKTVNVSTTTSGQAMPISIAISYDANTGKSIGEEDNSYFSHRGQTTSIYKVLTTDTIAENQGIVVGYIAPGQTGIDGNITVMAYLDANNIAICDTQEETAQSLLEGKTVFTTPEWNALQSEGMSFRVKVEAQLGTWVPQQ